MFLLNLICFAACIEGLFFFAAFAYVYFLRSKGLLHGLAAGTNWVFRDESAHMSFALKVVEQVRKEEPLLFDAELERSIVTMLDEAVDCEMQFAQDILSGGISGLSVGDMRQYLEYIADQRLAMLGLNKVYGAKNPFSFMGPAGRAGAGEFLRAACVSVSGRGRRRGEFQRGVLVPA